MNWISARTAAKILGVTHPTILNWVKSGKLQPIGTIDGVVLIFDRAYVERVAELLRKSNAVRAAAFDAA